ncbi:MAG: trypsin-like peptidase domain-containing protein [Planctomycetia bacterium]|nr:trypsin-like peptidase domain-containing protein [Planctomycetia bacterium]
MHLRLMPALLLFASSVAFAQQSIPEAKLKELKDATVFVKLDSGRLHATGSGFLFFKDGNTGFIATNAHVVESPDGAPRTISVVFFSGQKEEFSLAATAVGEDPDRDLAILKVQREGLPKALSLATKCKPRETLPVFILGFPFGEMLRTSEKNPAITIGRGSVSSLRLDDEGELAIVQIDGDINHGNSGGPIVDASGALVGVTVAKVEGTGIGFAIPARELDLMLEGRIQSVKFEERSNVAGALKFEAVIGLIDPMGKVKNVSVLFVPGDKAAPVGKPEKASFPRIGPDAQEFPLKVQGATARGEVTLKGTVGTESDFLYQPKYVGATGKPIFLQPSKVRVAFSAAGAAEKPPDKPEARPPDTPGDDWLGGGDKPGPATPGTGSKPTEGTGNLAGPRRTVVDAVATEIKLNSRELIGCLCWSADGQSFYAVEKGGIVRRVSWPGLDEERRFETGGNCVWAGLSKEGLVVLVQSIQEGWVLDPVTLEPKRKFPTASASRFATSPASSFAFFHRDRGNLDAVDLRTGKVAKSHVDRDIQAQQGPKIRRHKDGVTLSDFNYPTMTPDGRYLVCVGFECLHRFKVDGASLVYEEMGPRLGNNPQGIEISADSKYVCMMSGGGNSNPSDHPKVGGYSTYIYKASDLLMPVLTIQSGAYPRTLDFDKSSGRIYAQNYETQLITFGGKGVREKEYKLGTGETRQLLAHPSGSKVLVLSEAKLFAVEIGAGESPVAGGSSAAPPVTPEKLPDVPAASSALRMVDELKPSARLSLKAAVPDMALAPDGSFLYVLDQSEGRILKLRPADLAVQAECRVSPECVAMALGPKGDRIYLVSRRDFADREGGGPSVWTGRLNIYETSTFAPAGEADFDGDPFDVAVTGGGLVAVTCIASQQGLFLIDTASRKPTVTTVRAVSQGFLHVHPDQTRIYYCSDSNSSAGPSCLYLIASNAPPPPGDQAVFWAPRSYTGRPMSGEFLITPDGRTFLSTTGAVAHLSPKRDDDFAASGQAEPWIAAAAAPGCDSVLLATDQAFLKQFSLSRNSVEKSLKTPGLCPLMAFDGTRKVLYALETAIPASPGSGSGGVRRPAMAGDIVAWPLEAK